MGWMWCPRCCTVASSRRAYGAARWLWPVPRRFLGLMEVCWRHGCWAMGGRAMHGAAGFRWGWWLPVGARWREWPMLPSRREFCIRLLQRTREEVHHLQPRFNAAAACTAAAMGGRPAPDGHRTPDGPRREASVVLRCLNDNARRQYKNKARRRGMQKRRGPLAVKWFLRLQKHTSTTSW
jgi:hypothetical protein